MNNKIHNFFVLNTLELIENCIKVRESENEMAILVGKFIKQYGHLVTLGYERKLKNFGEQNE